MCVVQSFLVENPYQSWVRVSMCMSVYMCVCMCLCVLICELTQFTPQRLGSENWGRKRVHFQGSTTQ